MPVEIIEPIAALFGLLGMGTIGLFALKAWLHAKAGRRSQISSEDVERLTEAIESLREQVHMVREEHSELFERVEFAERMLTKGGAGAANDG